MWIQTTLNLRPQPRGFHLVTDEIVASLPDLVKFERQRGAHALASWRSAPGRASGSVSTASAAARAA